ncbi:MAG: MFS transporter [Anaerolineaceae bacterium]|nr:MFS transporter [Anaerolineaceae bacterium]
MGGTGPLTDRRKIQLIKRRKTFAVPFLLPSRQRQWQVLLPLGIGTILALAGDLTLYAVLPAYASTRAFDLATVGLLLSANRLVRLGSNPLIGLLISGARRRGFVLTGFGLGALSTLLYLLPGTGVFLAGRLLWGISWSLIYIGGYCMLLDITNNSDRGQGSGILQGFYFIGLAFNPLLGGLLNDLLGFSSALTICAALSAAGFLFAFLFLPETMLESGRTRLAFNDVLRGFASMTQRSLAAARELAHLRNFAANYLYLATHFVGDGILLSTLSLYLRIQYGDTVGSGSLAIPIATAGGALLALRAGISAAVAPLAGKQSDRARSRWLGIGWGVALGAGGMLLISGLDTPLALLGGTGLVASGGAVVMTITPALVKEVNPKHESGTIIGLLANSADLGMALAPLTAYALVESLPLRTIYLLAGIMLAAGLPLAWAAARQK